MKLYRDPLTGKMSEVQRLPLLQHIYDQQGSDTNLHLETLQRVAELERRGG